MLSCYKLINLLTDTAVSNQIFCIFSRRDLPLPFMRIENINYDTIMLKCKCIFHIVNCRVCCAKVEEVVNVFTYI